MPTVRPLEPVGDTASDSSDPDLSDCLTHNVMTDRGGDYKCRVSREVSPRFQYHLSQSLMLLIVMAFSLHSSSLNGV
jgi:hypothetical protein